MARILLHVSMLSPVGFARRPDKNGPPRRTATLMAVAGLVLVWPPGAAGQTSVKDPAVTTRVTVDRDGVALQARLLQQAAWGRGLAVLTAGDAPDTPLAVVLGLETDAAVAGPVAATGAWRELAAVHGHDAGSTVFHEATGLRLRSGLEPGTQRGVQLRPTPGFAVTGFHRLGAAGAVQPPTIGLAASPAPGSPLQLEAYAALRTEAPPERPPAWVLETAPFPGGVLALAGVRLGLAGIGAGLWASANVSGGPRVPAGGYARLAARGDLRVGELRAVLTIAGRGYRDLSGTAAAAPLAWALQFRGAPGTADWKLTYRLDARGEELSPAWPAPRREEPAPRELALAVTPALSLGDWTLSATGRVEVDAAGPALSGGARLAGEPGSLAVTWRGGGRGSLRVRGAVTVAAVTVEAALTAAGGAASAELGLGLRTPGFNLRAGVRKLGLAPPAGPAVRVTFTTPG